MVSDQLTDPRRFRVLAVVDDRTRDSLRPFVDTLLSGQRVARELDVLIGERGNPITIVSDNGPEFTSTAIVSWADQAGVHGRPVTPEKPRRNGLVESVNGSL